MRAPMPESRGPEEHPEFREVPRSVREVGYLRDVVRWGPVIGGTFAAISIMVVLTILGVAVGLASIGPGGTVTSTLTTAWAIWSAISMIIALFFGGWLAARTSWGTGTFSGIVDGSLVWATTLLIALFLTGFGVASALGPVLGQFNLFGVGGPAAPGAIAPDIAGSAFWAFIGLVVSYIAALAGGLFGVRQEEHVVPPRV